MSEFGNYVFWHNSVFFLKKEDTKMRPNPNAKYHSNIFTAVYEQRSQFFFFFLLDYM